MPLIACPDCNRDISDAAPACPQCGRPMPQRVIAPKVVPLGAVVFETCGGVLGFFAGWVVAYAFFLDTIGLVTLGLASRDPGAVDVVHVLSSQTFLKLVIVGAVGAAAGVAAMRRWLRGRTRWSRR